MLPLLLLVVVGGLFLSLSVLFTSELTHAAQEAAGIAARAPDAAEACLAAIAAVETVAGVLAPHCTGIPLLVEYSPGVSVTVTLTGDELPIPLWGTIRPTGRAVSIIEDVTVSP